MGGYVTALSKGDVVNPMIWREGKELEVSLPVSLIKKLVPSHFHNSPPPYLIFSGIEVCSEHSIGAPCRLRDER